MKAKTFVIHLERAAGRRANVEKLLGMLPFAPEILSAVDAEKLRPEEFAAVSAKRLLKPFYPFALRQTEIACFLSHRKAWRRIAEGELDAGLIVEDDIEIDTGKLGQILRVAEEALQPDDYLRFPQYLRDENGPAVAEAEGAALIEPRLPGRRMFMQLVGRGAAEKLLGLTEKFDRPVDALLQMRWLLPLRVLAARPICVREISGALGGTTIQGKGRPWPETLRRELLRPIYRAAVQLRARSGTAVAIDEAIGRASFAPPPRSG